MVNRPKKAGTAAETLVARYCHPRGWPKAKRNPPAGSKDVGDLDMDQPKLVVEVKADKGLAFPKFLRETEAERVNAGASVGVCVIKPPGVADRRMHLWWMLMSGGTYDALELVANAKARLVGEPGFMAWFYDERHHEHVSEKGSKAFKVDKCLVHAKETIAMNPGTLLKPGVKRISSAVGDMRFLYLPDGLELLRLAGLGGESDA